MKRFLAAVIFAALTTGWPAVAQDAPPISPAQLQKILKFVDTIGIKQEFPAPAAQNLGISTDMTQTLPLVMVATNDHKVYFGRSELNPADFVIWARSPETNGSYMFSTRSDFKLIRALYLRDDGFPDIVDGDTTQIQAVYKKALAALVKDVNSTPSK
jgi:hypothetical protein